MLKKESDMSTAEEIWTPQRIYYRLCALRNYQTLGKGNDQELVDDLNKQIAHWGGLKRIDGLLNGDCLEKRACGEIMGMDWSWLKEK